MIRLTIHLAAALVASLTAASHAAEPVFRAGVHAVNIDPPRFPISVNGGMSDRQATGVHDPLHARCFVLDDGATKIAIVIVDSCMVPREIYDEAKRRAATETGIRPDHMLMAATHTHTAPTVAGVFQSDPDADYVRFLTDKLAEGVVKAHANLATAKIGWAVGSDPTQVFNRRWFIRQGESFDDPFGGGDDRVKMNPGYANEKVERPAGPIDPQVPIISLQSPDGRPVGLLANYSLHYVGGVEALSADYFAAFAQRIAQRLNVGKTNPPFLAAMSNGTSGDINNVNFALRQAPARKPYEQIGIVADSVAEAAHTAYKTIEHRGHVTLAMKETEIELGVRKPSADELARARKVLEEAKAAGKSVLNTMTEIYARESVLLAEYPDTVNVKLQAIRIGELGIAAIPCETFVEIGLAIKQKSPLKPTFTIELANGYNGYLPTAEQHKMGGYETWRARSSYLTVDAAEKIQATVLRLLNEVAGK